MNRLVIVAIFLGLLAMLASSMVYVVDQRQFAVRYALGEIVEVIDEPGLYFKAPAPLQNVEFHDKRILTIDNADTDRFVTAEKLNLVIDYYVKWRISEPRRYIRSVRGRESEATDRILRSLRDALQTEVAKLTVDDVISTERDKLMNLVRSQVDADSETIGVDVIDVRLKRVDFEESVQTTVFERMRTERKEVADERRATGREEKNKIEADADRQREVILANAYRDAQRIKGDGDARAAKAYGDAYGRNAEFAEFYRSLQAYRESFKQRSDVLVLDPSSEFFKYFRNDKGASAPAK
jgi:membrane protease subunit HflC